MLSGNDIVLKLKQPFLKVNVFLLFLCIVRHALDIREHYERKLERANNLYMELSAIMLQLEVREKELMKYENTIYITIVIIWLYCCSSSFFDYQALWVVSIPPNLSSKAFQVNEIFEIVTMAWQNN